MCENENMLFSSNKNNTIITICYGRKKEWKDINDAIIFFLDCYYSSEGNEKNRYEKILSKLFNGNTICSDE